MVLKLDGDEFEDFKISNLTMIRESFSETEFIWDVIVGKV